MVKSIKLRACDLCNQNQSILYRLQFIDQITWSLTCKSCWKLVSDRYPNYRYGGTWKARKKR